MIWRRYRTVVESAAATASVDKFSDEFDRFDQAWEGVKWRLSHKPEIGKRGEYSGLQFCLYNFAGDTIAGTPEIWVVYSYDDDEVLIERVHAVHAEQRQ